MRWPRCMAHYLNREKKDRYEREVPKLGSDVVEQFTWAKRGGSMEGEFQCPSVSLTNSRATCARTASQGDCPSMKGSRPNEGER